MPILQQSVSSYCWADHELALLGKACQVQWVGEFKHVGAVRSPHRRPHGKSAPRPVPSSNTVHRAHGRQPHEAAGTAGQLGHDLVTVLEADAAGRPLAAGDVEHQVVHTGSVGKWTGRQRRCKD